MEHEISNIGRSEQIISTGGRDPDCFLLQI